MTLLNRPIHQHIEEAMADIIIASDHPLLFVYIALIPFAIHHVAPLKLLQA